MLTQSVTNLNHMIENLHTLMRSFKWIKILVRQGLPSTLRIRTAESDTDWMFVFPRLHSQHASARSERSCDSTALPTLYFWGWEMAATRKKLSKWDTSTSLGYADSMCPVNHVHVWYSLISNGSVWRKSGCLEFHPCHPLTDLQPPNQTHTFFPARFYLIFSITPSFSKSKSSRKVISHMFEDLLRVAMHIIQ